MIRRVVSLVAIALGVLGGGSHLGRAQDLTEVRALIQHGEYDLALLQLQESTGQAGDDEARTLLGDLLRQLGRHREAAAILRPLALEHPTSPHAILAYARLLFDRGQLSEAMSQLDAALALDRSIPQVRLLRGQIHARLGHTNRSRGNFEEIVSSYEAGLVTTAEHMTIVGIAYHQLGRYEQSNSIFGLALQMEPDSIEARLGWADLLLEKYRPDEAEALAREILEINPRHPMAKVLLGRALLCLDRDAETATRLVLEALQVNPGLVQAHELLAAMALDEEDYWGAIDRLEEVLEINPTRLESLGLTAAAYFLLDDLEQYRQLERRVAEINRRYIEFPVVVAEFASHAGRHEEVVDLYQQALGIDPDYWRANLGLGLTLSRLGQDDAGLEYFRRALESDPFNVQAYHLINLYERNLADYELVESEHFQFRFPRDERVVLQSVVMPLVEWVYARYVERYGFEPEGPISVELFTEPETFAVRSTGLPHVDSHGISFGRVVTGRSPSDGNFNWAEVLAHELSHVFTMQLSHARVPRWLTEGMAEYDTHLLRPEWNREGRYILTAQLKASELPGLSQLSRAFVRYSEVEQVMTAYYQSMLAVQFLSDHWGQDAPIQMLRLFGQGEHLSDVLQQVTGLNVGGFDEAFLDYLRVHCQSLTTMFDPNPIQYRDETEFEAGVQDNRDSARAWAELAMAKFFAQKIDECEIAFHTALQLDPANPQANLLAAWFSARQRRYTDAHNHLMQILYGGFDGYSVRIELANVSRLEGRTSEAIEHYRRAQEVYPEGSDSYRELADIYIRAGETEAAIDQLQHLVLLDQFDFESVMTLLDLLIAAQRTDEAWTTCALGRHIRPFSREIHERCGFVAVQQRRWGEARVELELAIVLGSDSEEIDHLMRQVDEAIEVHDRVEASTSQSQHEDD